jgi:hypothetical protein
LSNRSFLPDRSEKNKGGFFEMERAEHEITPPQRDTGCLKIRGVDEGQSKTLLRSQNVVTPLKNGVQVYGCS